MASVSLKENIKEKALELGFDLCRVAPACETELAAEYKAWLSEGYHGEMTYMARTADGRLDPSLVLPGVRSIVVVAVSYHTVPWPSELRHDPSRGLIARYAWGLDYHDLLVPNLRLLADFLAHEVRGEVAFRVYVDTGPVMEKVWARKAGLGFIGKNTCLISPRHGSYLFLGVILTTAELEADPPLEKIGCGSCCRCLPSCPTGAFPKPYLLDARRCISYLTIELKGPIPRQLRPSLGNWIFGCDVCQEVCPWSVKFSRPSRWRELYPAAEDFVAPRLVEVIRLNEADFRARYRKRPVWRARRRGFLRNAAVALGNWGDSLAVGPLGEALLDSEPLIRGHAAWALGRIGGSRARRMLEAAWGREEDPYVREEIMHALEGDC